jgi:hypothetical protein
MSDYIVICLDPISKKRKVEILNYKGEDVAKKMAMNKKKQGLDVFLIKKNIVINKYNGKEEEELTLEKFGYFATYNFLNKIYSLIALILLCLISYLYFKYVPK